MSMLISNCDAFRTKEIENYNLVRVGDPCVNEDRAFSLDILKISLFLSCSPFINSIVS